MKKLTTRAASVLLSVFSHAALADGIFDPATNAVGSAGQTIGGMMVSLQNEYATLYHFLEICCYVLALLFFLVGVFRLHAASKPGQSRYSYTQILAGMLGSVVLFFVPEFLNGLSCTMGLTTTPTMFDYVKTTSSSSSKLAVYFTAVVDFVRFAGLIAMISGTLELRSVMHGTAGQNVTWKTVKWRLVGGALAWNFVTVAVFIANTFHLKTGSIITLLNGMSAAGNACI